MKKHLIAAAVAAAVGVPAAAQVSVSGNIDVTATRTNKVTTVTGSGNTVATTEQRNTGSGLGAGIDDASTTGWATSELIFEATEDLGGGLKATARISQNISGNAFGVQRDRYVNLAGGFGSVRLGRFNPITGGYNNYSGAGTTAQAGDLNHVATGGAKIFGSAITGGNFERNSGVVQYSSPSFNGVTVNAMYADNSSDVSTTANSITESKMQGLGAVYASGPLRLEFVSAERKNKTAAVAAVAARAFFFNGSNSTTGTQTTAGAATLGSAATIGSYTLPTGQLALANSGGGFNVTGIVTSAGVDAQLATDATHEFDWVGASYSVGPATLLASHARRKTESNSVTSATQATLNDAKINSVGLMVPMGATTFRVSAYNGEDSRGTGNTDDMKLSGHQIGATYSLSKRTYLYAVMGESEVKRDTVSSTGTERKEKSNSLGVVHTF